MAIWRSRDKTEWARSLENYRLLAEKISQQGEPLLAFDVTSEGLSIQPNDRRLRQLQGLSLARSGASERAKVVLESLRGEGLTDEETLGMLGRTYKDLAARASSKTERKNYLRRAAETYTQAYEKTQGYWTGINAATTNLLIGNEKGARKVALKVREQCLKEVADPGGDSYWEFAALGEAALILKDWAQADEWYGLAAKQAARRFGDLHSSRRNAHLILRYWKRNAARIDEYLNVPGVVVFAGHMIDQPDRTRPRFPREMESAVTAAIRRRVETLKPGFGFSSAACGSDILFLEAMIDFGAEISVVLPYNKEQFIRDSVGFISDSNWTARFERVLGHAAHIVVASDQRLEIGGVSYDFCNQMLLGLATIRTLRLDTKLIPMAVWDGLPGDGPGGAASAIDAWRSLGYKPEIVDLGRIGDGQRPGPADESIKPIFRTRKRNESGRKGSKQHFASRVVAILFADAVGFSKLAEPEVPRFMQHFLGAIARLSAKFRKTILAKNTWGDGLYFVFSDVDRAGNFALQLADLVTNTKWQGKGLPADLSLRIALHAGPVYEFQDPITGERSFSGTHVSRAARIEPITPRGQVYASEPFAALAAAEGSTNFTCDYVGQTPMAKGYGTLPTYHVRNKAPLAAHL